MFSKPLAAVLLVLACLTAAAGGAYVANRHNQSDAAAVSSHASTEPSGAPAAAQPVAETEATVTAPAVTPAPAEAITAGARCSLVH